MQRFYCFSKRREKQREREREREREGERRTAILDSMASNGPS